jgi:hypothetical protein
MTRWRTLFVEESDEENARPRRRQESIEASVDFATNPAAWTPSRKRGTLPRKIDRRPIRFHDKPVTLDAHG